MLCCRWSSGCTSSYPSSWAPSVSHSVSTPAAQPSSLSPPAPWLTPVSCRHHHITGSELPPPHITKSEPPSLGSELPPSPHRWGVSYHLHQITWEWAAVITTHHWGVSYHHHHYTFGERELPPLPHTGTMHHQLSTESELTLLSPPVTEDDDLPLTPSLKIMKTDPLPSLSDGDLSASSLGDDRTLVPRQ